MVRSIKDLWYKIDNGRGQIELSIQEVAHVFSRDWQIVPDQSGAIKFI